MEMKKNGNMDKKTDRPDNDNPDNDNPDNNEPKKDLPDRDRNRDRNSHTSGCRAPCDRPNGGVAAATSAGAIPRTRGHEPSPRRSRGTSHPTGIFRTVRDSTDGNGT